MKQASISFMTIQSFVGWAWIATILVRGTDCLLCYQCATSASEGPNSPCIFDLQGLVNTSLGINDIYYKDCTATNPAWTRCMIETAESNGQFTFFHRGCHDGKEFTHEFNSTRFHNLPPNNYSTCDNIGVTNKMVCYRYCNTDYCNGPQPPVSKTDSCQLFNDDPDYELPDNMTCGASARFLAKTGPIRSFEIIAALVCIFILLEFP